MESGSPEGKVLMHAPAGRTIKIMLMRSVLNRILQAKFWLNFLSMKNSFLYIKAVYTFVKNPQSSNDNSPKSY